MDSNTKPTVHCEFTYLELKSTLKTKLGTRTLLENKTASIKSRKRDNKVNERLPVHNWNGKSKVPCNMHGGVLVSILSPFSADVGVHTVKYRSNSRDSWTENL